MTPEEKFSNISAKVKWANTRLDNLKVARDGFMENKPFVVAFNIDTKTGHYLYYLTDIKIDSDIGLMAGDVVHNLRSALDHLAFQLVISPAERRSPRDTCFPISESATGYSDAVAKAAKGMSESAKNKIGLTEAYQGGKGHYIWLLHKLDIADKHHEMLFAPIAPLRARIDDRGKGFAFPSSFGIPLKDGDIFYECEPGLYDDTEFTFDITLAKPRLVKGVPLVEMLRKMLDTVDALVTCFKPELA